MRLFQRLISKFVVRYGPCMLHLKWAGYWVYIDSYGEWYKVVATNDRNSPLRITRTFEP